MRVALFDTDAQRRSTLAKKLAEEGHDVEECYSEEKFAHKASKYCEGLILCPESLVGLARQYVSENIILSYADMNPIIQLPDHLGKPESLQRLVMIGSSTGGVPVVIMLLKELWKNREAIKQDRVVVCQHIGAGELSQNLFETLKKSFDEIKLVDKELPLTKAGVYLLAGGSDYEFKEKYDRLFLRPSFSEDYHYHPSFEKLVESSCPINIPKVVLVLSGLGNDGAKSLRQFKISGGKIYVQDPQQSVARFMPDSAIASGQADLVLPVEELSRELLRRAA